MHVPQATSTARMHKVMVDVQESSTANNFKPESVFVSSDVRKIGIPTSVKCRKPFENCHN